MNLDPKSVTIKIPQKAPHLVIIRSLDSSIITSKQQLYFLKKVAENDVEYLDKLYKEKPHVYWRLIYKLKKGGFIKGRGRPYRLTEKGKALLKIIPLVLKEEKAVKGESNA